MRRLKNNIASKILICHNFFPSEIYPLWILYHFVGNILWKQYLTVHLSGISSHMADIMNITLFQKIQEAKHCVAQFFFVMSFLDENEIPQ